MYLNFFLCVKICEEREREREIVVTRYKRTVLLTNLLTRQWNEIATWTLTKSHTNDRVVRIVIDVIIKEDVMCIRTIKRQPQRFSCTWDIIIVFPKNGCRRRRHPCWLVVVVSTKSLFYINIPLLSSSIWTPNKMARRFHKIDSTGIV